MTLMECGLPLAHCLTAHALSVDDTVKSYKEGAASCIPKDEMANISAFLEDIGSQSEGSEFLVALAG